MLIKTGDIVEVRSGNDRGTRAKVLARAAGQAGRKPQGDRGRGRQPRVQARPPQPEEPAGRAALQGDADRRLQRAAGLHRLRQGHPARAPGRRPTAARCGSVGSAGPSRARCGGRGRRRRAAERDEQDDDGDETQRSRIRITWPRRRKAASTATLEPAGTPRLLEHYVQTVRPHLAKALGQSNPHAIPGWRRSWSTWASGRPSPRRSTSKRPSMPLAQIAGQKPIVTLSQGAVAGFRLRENMPIGCKVTLRGSRMYEFLDRLISLALPRVRDFRGLSADRVRRPRQLQPGALRAVGFPELNPDNTRGPRA